MIEARGHSGRVVFDGQAVTIYREGLLARAVVGTGTTMIPIGSITAVQIKPAGVLVNGFIEFTPPGVVETSSRAGNTTMGAGRNENAVIFTRRQAPAFDGIAQAVRDAIAARQAAGTPHEGSASGRECDDGGIAERR